jgi:hypothetical protein
MLALHIIPIAATSTSTPPPPCFRSQTAPTWSTISLNCLFSLSLSSFLSSSALSLSLSLSLSHPSLSLLSLSSLPPISLPLSHPSLSIYIYLHIYISCPFSPSDFYHYLCDDSSPCCAVLLRELAEELFKQDTIADVSTKYCYPPLSPLRARSYRHFTASISLNEM